MLESSYSYRPSTDDIRIWETLSFNPLCWSQVIPTPRNWLRPSRMGRFQSSMLESSYSYSAFGAAILTPVIAFQSSMLESSYSYSKAATARSTRSVQGFNPLCWSQVIPTVSRCRHRVNYSRVSILYVGVKLFLHSILILGQETDLSFNPLCWSQVIPTW